MPTYIGAEVERIRQPVGGDFPPSGQVGLHFSATVQSCQPAEHQGADITIHRVVSTQQGVQVMWKACDALDVRTSMAGAEHGGVIDGQVGQEDAHQHDADENEHDLPADVPGHALQAPSRVQFLDGLDTFHVVRHKAGWISESDVGARGVPPAM